MKVIFIACCTCFPSPSLMKKDIAQCPIKLYAEWVLENISQFLSHWLAIMVQSCMLYCRFIFTSNIYVSQYMSWVIQSSKYDMKNLQQFAIGNGDQKKYFSWLYLFRHIWLTVWAFLKAGLISLEHPGGDSVDCA